MAYHFEFDSANKILNCSFKGSVSDEELKEFYAVAGTYVERTKPRAAIIDFSAVQSFEVSPITVRKLAAQTPIMANPAEPRIVVAPEPAVFGLARMFELEGQATRPNFHVVQTLREACAILGVQVLEWQPVAEE